MVLGLCLAREAGVLCSVGEDGAAKFVDGRAPGVAKTLGAAGGRSVVESVRDAYIACGDCLAKNKLKLTMPRGEGQNAMSMF